MKEKIYAKVFNLEINEDELTTETNFNLFKEKFEIIRSLYFDKKINRDTYDSFRSIVKEVKRAAHNAGLNAKYCEDIKYTFEDDGNIAISSKKTFYFNLIVYFKRVAKLRNSFIITEICFFEDGFLVPGSESKFPNGEELGSCPLHLYPFEDFADFGDIVYTYIPSEEWDGE